MRQRAAAETTPSGLRLCFCNSNAAWGGGELWHLTFARMLQERGHETRVLAAAGSALAARTREAGLALTEMPLSRLSFLQPLHMARLVRYFRRHRPHAVLLGLPQDLKAAGQAARLAGVPLVLYRRGMGLPVRDSLFNRHLYRNVAHGVLVNAADTRRALLENNPDLLPQERIHLLHNGVPATLLQAAEAPVGQEVGRSVIATAGRLVPQKGQTHLLRAAALLQEQGVDFELRIAGEGPLRQELEAQAAALGVAGRVRFQGFVQDMQAFYREAQIFAFPSLWEGMGNALLEAMAAGLPVVGFAVSSMAEAVRQEETGLLVPGGDEAALAAALERLCRDAGERARLGGAGRKRVAQEFILERQVARFEELLAGLLEKGERTP